MTSRSTDSGTEKRETYSFSTQISQMYHLLDSYHLGTNRAIFFVQPRPHTIEEPSGFVRGPRPVEGIQEFFMVVALPRAQSDFCVAVRLDTSHLTTVPIMDYDRKSVSTSIATANARVATRNDIPAENIVGARACFFDCWDVHYQCYRTEVVDTITYDAETGYRIENYVDLINEATHGSSSVTVTPNRHTLTINAEAQGHICYEGSEVCVDCPDTIQEWAGHARRQVQVNLISTAPTKQIGESQALMVTTRGLCCCASGPIKGSDFGKEFVTKIAEIPQRLAPARYFRGRERTTVLGSLAFLDAPAARGAAHVAPMLMSHASIDYAAANETHACEQCAGLARDDAPIAMIATGAGDPAPGYTMRQANELSDYIRRETLKSLSDPLAKRQRYVETDFFAKQLEYAVGQTAKGRKLLARAAKGSFSDRAIQAQAKRLMKEPADVTVADMLALQGKELANTGGINAGEIQRLKLAALGVSFARKRDPKDKGKGSAERKKGKAA